jgi:unsaturated rhamnogalacturonyl hydrolase
MQGFVQILVLLICGFVFPHPTSAEEPGSPEHLEKVLSLVQHWPGAVGSTLGVTAKDTPIVCLYHKDDLDFDTKKTRILLVAGFQDQAGTLATMRALHWFHTFEEAAPFRERFLLSAVPWVNPDDAPPPRFPPKGDAYNSNENTEAEYLWRWIGMQAPDLVVCLTAGGTEQWWSPDVKDSPVADLAKVLGNKAADDKLRDSSAGSLTSALVSSAPCHTGTIPAITAALKPEEDQAEAFIEKLLKGIENSKFQGPSPARRELQNRVDREPLEIAKQLAEVYGHDLPSVQYIPALALVGRLRLGELTNDPSHRADVERIVAPYVAGDKRALPEKFSGSDLAGHLIFSELARTADDPQQKQRYQELAQNAAETGFDAQGGMLEAMPAHNEMSDAVFMGCPILAEAGVLTGEEKYLKMADRHFAFMRKRVLRDDGLYRHSPLCEAAWGRGNGFPALGLAWSLSVLPEDHPLFQTYLKEFQNHMRALVEYQDPDGMWHQVVDDTASYRELSSTSMITFAMIRGVRNGWLEEAAYGPEIEKAFRAIKTRIAADGSLVDVCTGTGKQKTLRDYYDRKAILGRDARGGAMALLVTTEMARGITRQ